MQPGTGFDDRRVLVTGAGCLGRVLVRKLADAGADVKVVDLADEKLTSLGDGVATVRADVTDTDAVRAASEGRDIVFHTAALLGGSADQVIHVNVHGTRVVAEAAALAGARRFVHISSNAVYGIAQRGALTEDRGPSPSDQAYSMSKAAGEAVVEEVSTGNGMAYTIIRPAGIFGPGAEYFTASFFKRATRRPIVFVGRGRGAQAVAYVDDVADLAMHAALHPNAVNEVFNCAIDPPPTAKEYVHAYGELTDNRSWVGLPMPVVKAASWLVVPFAKKHTYARHLPQNLDFVDSYVTYPMEKAKRLLDWEPQVDVTEGVRRSIPWLRERGLYDGAGPDAA